MLNVHISFLTHQYWACRDSLGLSCSLCLSCKIHLSAANPLCGEMEQIPPSRHVQPIYYHYCTTSGCLGHQQSKAIVCVLKLREHSKTVFETLCPSINYAVQLLSYVAVVQLTFDKILLSRVCFYKSQLSTDIKHFIKLQR